MTVHTLQVNGTRGEITPLMHARVDTDFYQAGYALARNVIVTRYGALTRSPGTLFDGVTKSQDRRSRLLPFEFSDEQVYALEFGHQYIRFWTPEGQVFSGGSPYEIASPYTDTSLARLQVVQSGDALYLFNKGYQPRILKRNGETNWTLTNYVTKDGPYLPINTTGTRLTPAAYGSPVPVMTGLTTPSGTVTSSASNTDAWKVFDRQHNDVILSGATGWVSYEFGGGATRVVDAYYLRASSDVGVSDRMASAWTIEGYDGANWVTLDSRTGETGWAGGEIRHFTFINEAAYERYRLAWTANDSTATEIRLSEWGLHERAEEQTPFNLTASSVVGLNDGVGFTASDVGRSIRLLGSDGRWRWARIVARLSPTVVTVRLFVQAFTDLSPVANWALGAWSDSSGWPTTGALFEDRLVTAGAENDPVGVWASVIGGYDSYRQSTPLQDDDGLSLRLTGGRMNPIQWLADSGALLAGTGGSLRSIGSRDNSSGPLSATNVRQRSETVVGASEAPPASIENVVLFIDRAKQRMYEAAYDFQADGYLAREVSTLNEHLFAAGVEQIAFMSTPHKIMWCRRADGKMIAFAYDREQKVVGGTLVDFGGFVEDVMTMVGRDGVDVWMVMRRTVDGQTRRYVERLAPFYRSDLNGGSVPVYGACSVVYDGADTGTLTGLSFLQGETLGVWVDGRDIGDAVVSSGGALTLPFGLTGERIVVGKRMPWALRTLRLPQIGNQDGSGLGRKVRIVSAKVDLYDAAGIVAGTLSETYPLTFEDEAEEDPDTPVQLREGMYKMPADDSWQNSGVFAIEGDRMYPATVRGISLEVDGEP